MADEQATPNTERALPSVPASWPGAFGAYKYSKKAVMVNIWTLVVLWLISAIVGGLAQKSLGNAGGLVSALINILITVGYTLTFIAGVRGQSLAIGDALSKSLSYWLKMIGLAIVVGLTLVVSFICFVIPFLIVLPRLSLSHYFLIDKNMGVMEAYKASWAATKGHSSKVWGIIGAAIAMALLSITIIGIPFSIYFLIMYSAAYAVLYEFLNRSAPAPAKAAPADAPAAA